MIDVSAFVKKLDEKPVAVFGLGISNMAAIRALKKAGAGVAAWDDSADRRSAAQTAGAMIRDLAHEDLSGYACLVLAPGVPLHFPEPHAVVKAARKAGIEVLCDLEILHRCGHGRRTIGITGTNGKSTTTALIGHILNERGVPAAVGGNIGTAALALDMPPENGVIVLEISSYQMDLCPTFRPDIAVMLNITPDHLDRHGTLENYAAAKARMFEGPGDAVIGVDDVLSEKIYKILKNKGDRHCFPVSVVRETQDGVYVKDGKLFDDIEGGGPRERFSFSETPMLPGAHNHQNAAMAYVAARRAGLEPADIFKAMKTFPGLAHRQFLVRTINGVPYVNDSKATNAAATEKALACYRNIYWIAGGKPKEGGLSGLEPHMDRIRHAFLIGEAADEFGTWLDKCNVPHSFCGTLEKAVTAAHDMAQAERGQPGGASTVLLSPACASFDQFRNFEHRGDMFRAFVEDLHKTEVAA